MSGFTPAGAAKIVPRALAARATAEHAAGRPFKVAVVSGASTGDSLDGELARADAISRRMPYQSNKSLRESIHAGRIPKGFLPVQSGVGNIANAVLGGLGAHPGIPAFEMYPRSSRTRSST